MFKNVWGRRFPRLVLLLLVIVAITAEHYLTGISQQTIELHNIHYLLYLLPILMASIWYGLYGGIATAVTVSILYAPVVFGPHGRTVFTSGTQRVLELTMYMVIGLVTGLLSEREKRESEDYRRTAEELRKAYQKLHEQTDLIIEKEDQLRRAERLSTLGELAAEVTHEIRNPLASIKGTAEILQDASVPESKREEFAKLMLDEVNRLNGVVENFLRLSRFKRLRREKANINDILWRMLQIVEVQLNRKKISVRPQFAPQLPELELDVSQMEQAILNLLLNAVAAMPGGGILDVKTELRNQDGAARVSVEIKDTGVGIAPEHIAHIFEPFYTTRPDGTGLGLSIVKRVLKAHGGIVEISSEPGHGARVRFSLPLDSEASQ